MFRRILAICVIALLLQSIALADATDRVGAFEFCELYMQRHLTYQDKLGVDYGGSSILTTHIFGPYNNGKHTTVEANVTAGLLSLDVDDLTVTDLMMTVMDTSSPYEKNTANMISCVVAISALEFGSSSEQEYQRSKVFGIEAATPYEKAQRIWDEDIFPNISSELFVKIIENDEEVLIYSGNYDYYVYYTTSIISETDSCSYLIARERE